MGGGGAGPVRPGASAGGGPVGARLAGVLVVGGLRLVGGVGSPGVAPAPVAAPVGLVVGVLGAECLDPVEVVNRFAVVVVVV